MRVDVVKILFVGVEKEKDRFFAAAQEQGLIEFINPKGSKDLVNDAEVHKFLAAIKILRGFALLPQLEGMPSQVAMPAVERILALHTDILKLNEEMRRLEVTITRNNIFGEFSLEDLAFIKKEGKYEVRFFCRAQSKVDKPCDKNLIDIGAENGLEYFIAIDYSTDELKNYEGMIEIKIDKSLNTLHADLEAVKSQTHLYEQELKNYSQYNRFLHKELIERLDLVHLKKAKECTEVPIEGKLFVVTAWVSLTSIPKVQELCSDLSVYNEQIVIEEKDVIPTNLENKNSAKIGEDLVNIYDTPSITDHDPSLWVLYSFIFFFAIIINDAGYGFIFLLISLFLYYKFPKVSSFGKRVIKLSIMISSACVIWGILTTSFFGIEVSVDNPIRKVSIIDYLAEKKAAYHMEHQDEVYKEWVRAYPGLAHVTSPKAFLDIEKPSPADPKKVEYPIRDSFSGTILFEFALIIGTLHVISSFLRNLRRSWAGAGWVIFMVGAYLYFPHVLHATSLIHYALGVPLGPSEQEGLRMLYGGIGLALVLAVIHKRLGGILEFTVFIQIFCDVLSYLRLYALGLAGMMMADTFNGLAANTGIVFGTLIIIAGHTVNMGISIMGGVIHGLRLNFLEWYHYSFEGGGRLFKPLKLTREKN
ncbi:MAG: V-type ATPase 116kDa subunit family protein [Chlamydiales bacterium]|nr:V-type ATPase 116kDa subunit family protein [Chlamydiales bacterium]